MAGPGHSVMVPSHLEEVESVTPNRTRNDAGVCAREADAVKKTLRTIKRNSLTVRLIVGSSWASTPGVGE